MPKILVISDNHGVESLIRKIITIEKAELVVHAGDFGISTTTMEELFDYFVIGNNDCDWKDIEQFTFVGFRFLLLHGDHQWSWSTDKWHDRLRSLGSKENIDVVIFGHSHMPYIDDKHKPYLFNPGSIAFPRGSDLQKSYGIIEIENNQLKFTIKYISTKNE